MKSNLLAYQVEGRGNFPFDMLRYAQAWPAQTEDAEQLAPKGEMAMRCRRRIKLLSASHQEYGARWDSFGWRVVPVEDQEGA